MSTVKRLTPPRSDVSHTVSALRLECSGQPESIEGSTFNAIVSWCEYKDHLMVSK